MSLFAPASFLLWQTIESYGLDAELLYSEEGISLQVPSDPLQRISLEAIDRIRNRATGLSGDEAFGLRMADFLHPSNFGALGYAWLASATLRSALYRLRNYIRVVSSNWVVQITEDDDALVITDPDHRDPLDKGVRDDCIMAILVQLCRFNCGKEFRPRKVSLRHNKPNNDGPWKEFFGCPVTFRAPENQMWISRVYADKLLPSANAQLAHINDQLIARDIARLDSKDIIARTRAVIIEQMASGNISEHTVSKAMLMTARNLHRKLSAENRNFSLILAEIRRETADRYLADAALTLTEITFLLGFSQVSSFSRAYKKWTGESPSVKRRKIFQKRPGSS